MATSPKNPQAEIEDAAVVAEAPAAAKISLNEFCIRLSKSITAPELIGAFAFTERAAGTAVDTEGAFQARYTAFINKPV